jgi:DNA replication protein DnaC
MIRSTPMTTPPDRPGDPLDPSRVSPCPLLREELKQRAVALKLHGLLAHWDEVPAAELPGVRRLIEWEHLERKRRGLERRLGAAHIGRFKPLADFDWSWPTQCDQAAVSGFMTLSFIKDTANIILVGPNGVGKSMIAQNIAHHAVMQGHSALFVNAAQMLGDLAAQDGDNALRRRLKHFAHPEVLIIDELGYLSYGNRHADLLFNIINRRYELKPTLVTTNRPFAEWSEVFPNAACVVSIVDRLVHHSEILVIEGESYRMREAKERAARKKKTVKPRVGANKHAPPKQPA